MGLVVLLAAVARLTFISDASTALKLSHADWAFFNVICDVASIFLLARAASHLEPTLVAPGFLLFTFSPLWFSESYLRTTEPLVTLLILLFLNLALGTTARASKEQGKFWSLTAGVLGIACGLWPVLIVLPVAFALWAVPIAKRKERIKFVVAAWITALPTLLISGAAFPSATTVGPDPFSKIVTAWITGWSSPFPQLFVPHYFGHLFVGVFCLPLLGFGIVGAFRAVRFESGHFSLIGRISAILGLYLFVSAAIFDLRPQETLPAQAILSLLMGAGISFLMKVASEKSRA